MDITFLQQLLASNTETEVLEFKKAENSYSKDKLGKYFSALGNEANLKGKDKAYFLLGIDDKTHKIVGTNISDDQLNEYKLYIASYTSPKMSFIEVERITIVSKSIIVFTIPPAPQGVPISWKGHRYGRDGESLGGLNDYELHQITSQNTDWSAEIIEDATLEDLDPKAIAFAREEYKKKNSKLIHEIDTWEDAKFLNKAKVTIKGKITRTAILLLGKSESEHFINPAVAQITWILKDRDNIEKDYEHFSCPFILAVDEVRAKIRNLKYRYIKSGTLFPDEVNQYEDYLIRESLHNCIAHQDYRLGGKIVVVENEDGWLSFSNVGDFIPESVEEVVMSDSPEERYRNRFLVNAMVNLNMIDTIGSGIKRMFNIQRNKFFPLPEYELSDNKVKVIFYGKVLDIKYAEKLASVPDLSLDEIIYLDKVAKSKKISKEEAQVLKTKGLIEGRRPNYHISSDVAKITDEKADYIKHRGLNDNYYEKLIIEYLKEFITASSSDFKELLSNKFPDVLDEKQKENKLRNMLQKLKRNKVIHLTADRKWKLQ
ncbi:MAG: putative DNA binding domain-containing protein [Brumimicrobium sp.]|nr:putative DNA binding domain-containing protein [Brumimicrobium sp.]